ncbi:MAG: hypothetical protein ACK4LT_01425 [Aquificaceae bacterium]
MVNKEMALGGLSLFFALSFLPACAPTLCPEGDQIKRSYSEHNAPSSYQASLSLRQGFLRIPIEVDKRDGRFAIRGEGKTLELNLGNLCIGGVCLDLPISPDGILFGKVLRGDEKLSCSFGGVFFERDEGAFKSRYIFKDGRLSLIELYDKRREKVLKISYLDWSKEGYAKAIKLEGENLSAILTVDSIKF